jgi:cytochrome c-type protein NapC
MRHKGSNNKVKLGMAALAGLFFAAPTYAVDWGNVKGSQVTLFYPGQSSWEHVLTPSDHEGAEKFRGGKDCLECHEDEEGEMGDTLSSGEKLEPDPVAGKPGSIAVEVKAAYDDERFYLSMSWDDTGFKAPQPESENLIHVNMMLGDGSVPSFSRGGCWATCHADVEGMPHDSPDLELTKYLAKSRTKVTRSGGGTSFKSDGDLQSLMKEGTFLEYWQAVIADTSAQAIPASGHILEKRYKDESAATSAEASLDSGRWTVTLSRPLKAAGPGQKTLAEGNTYVVGFAVHDGYADGRRHYVSFKRTLTLGGDGQIVATRQ